MIPWTFIVVADLQPGSPKSYRYNPSWIHNWREARAQILEISPDLLFVAGDLKRDGSIHRFELDEMKAEIDALPFPVHVVAGNMDTGNKHTRTEGRYRGPDQCTDIELNVTPEQLQHFTDVFGPLWWSFDHRGIRFSGITDMVINSDLPEEEAFWELTDAQRCRPPARHHVWMTHYPLFVEHPDEPTWELTDPVNYNNWYFSIDQPDRARLLDLFNATGAELVISGHVHCRKAFEFDGIRYQIAPATSFAQWKDRWPDGDPTLGFLRYDVSDAGIIGAFVPLRKTYQMEPYGPYGHPAPHARDYAPAWEK